MLADDVFVVVTVMVLFVVAVELIGEVSVVELVEIAVGSSDNDRSSTYM